MVAGSGVGGIRTLEDQVLTYAEKGPSKVSPFLVPMMMANATAALVGIRNGFTGPNLAVATACATGAHAIGEGARLVRDGMADVVVGRRHRGLRHPRDAWRPSPAWARSAATPTRRAPPGRSTSTATASSWARARRSSCSRRASEAVARGATIHGEVARLRA